MDGEPEGTITAFLVAMDHGHKGARERLWSAVYDELRTVAGAMMAREPAGHALQPTALVHEAYMRLCGGEKLRRQGRAYFFAAAAQAMRRILIDHARKGARKGTPRGREGHPLDDLTVPAPSSTAEGLLALDQALNALAEHDQRVCDVIMLRFFAGLTFDAVAKLLDLSARTVKRDWVYGRTWLYRRISTGPA